MAPTCFHPQPSSGSLQLSLAKVIFILKHSVKLGLYLLCGGVAACPGMTCVLCAVLCMNVCVYIYIYIYILFFDWINNFIIVWCKWMAPIKKKTKKMTTWIKNGNGNKIWCISSWKPGHTDVQIFLCVFRKCFSWLQSE